MAAKGGLVYGVFYELDTGKIFDDVILWKYYFIYWHERKNRITERIDINFRLE